jgi:hypothetical protein
MANLDTKRRQNGHIYGSIALQTRLEGLGGFSRCGSFSQKNESANPTQLSNLANPRYFILLCGISCALASVNSLSWTPSPL